MTVILSANLDIIFDTYDAAVHDTWRHCGNLQQLCIPRCSTARRYWQTYITRSTRWHILLEHSFKRNTDIKTILIFHHGGTNFNTVTYFNSGKEW